ncbi:hypothetical protein ACVWYG_003939 [Pedobacter sp. UYEF25]
MGFSLEYKINSFIVALLTTSLTKAY